jgi:hypothetical protein
MAGEPTNRELWEVAMELCTTATTAFAAAQDENKQLAAENERLRELGTIGSRGTLERVLALLGERDRLKAENGKLEDSLRKALHGLKEVRSSWTPPGA